MQPSGQSFEERQGLKALPYDNSHPTSEGGRFLL